MSGTPQVAVVGRGFVEARRAKRAWFGGLHGADYVWAVAFALPYAAIFLAFVVYPISFGIWMGSNPALYQELFSDPRYLMTVANTLIYVGIGVNLKLFVASC
jgi:multiple sugar transport system permease protein